MSLRLHSQHGSAVVTLLILMPLFAAIFALSAVTYLMIRTDARSRHVCRTELLKSQSKVAERLNQLLKLNPEARNLRGQRSQADQWFKIAPDPVSKAAAAANLARVIAKQVVLKTQQQALIAQAKTESQAGPSRVSRQVSSSLHQDRAVYRSRVIAIGLHSIPEPASFDLRATPPFNLTPDYEPAFQFEKSQTMRVRWKFSLGPMLPDWLTSLLTPTSEIARLALSADCAATLRKEDSKWFAVLSAVSL